MKHFNLALILFVALQSQAQSPAGAQEVLTGVHLMNIYNLDINQHSFYADFYVWFKWKGDHDPTEIEFVNAVEKWGFTSSSFYEEPKLLSDGYWYNGMRVEGRFYHPFELSRFPLDMHQLDVHIENSKYPADSLVYIPDTNAVSVREQFAMPGWEIGEIVGEKHTNLYPTNFGETDRNRSAYSNFSFNIPISRPVNYFLLKLLLPLLIVLLVCLGSMAITPLNIDGRISLAIGGLLAVVFLQQSYSDALPDVGYMVLMDKIYLLVYVAITLIMFRVVGVSNYLARKTSETNAANAEKLHRMDFWLILVMLGVLFVGTLLLVVV